MKPATNVRDTDSRTPRRNRGAVGFVAALALIVAGCGVAGADDTPDEGSAASAVAAADVVELSPAETAALLDEEPDAVVIDVRTPAEVDDEGALAGASFIDLQGPDFRERVDELDRDATYILYCRTGNRSGQAAEIMRELGFDALYNAGGFDDLRAGGLPTQP